MNVQRATNPEQQAGELCTELIGKDEKEVLFLVSGGSAFGLLDHIDKSVLGEHITLGIVDERYDTDPTVNNFSQLQQTHFYTTCVSQGCQFLGTRVKDGESHQEYTRRFGEMLAEHQQKHVVAVLGIGTDGHTAGIMPFPEDEQYFKQMFEGSGYVVGYDVGDKNQFPLRTTVTNTFLRECVNEFVVFVTGENKTGILSDVLQTSVDIHKVPARVIHSMKNGTLITNIDA